MSYVYLPAMGGEPATVGFYDPSGKWHPESDHKTDAEAAARVHYLNGGNDPSKLDGPLLGEGGYPINRHF